MSEAARLARETADPVEAFLAGRVAVKVGTLAEAFDYSVDHLDLEIRRGSLEVVGAGRRRRVPVDSARRWLLAQLGRQPVEGSAERTAEGCR